MAVVVIIVMSGNASVRPCLETRRFGKRDVLLDASCFVLRAVRVGDMFSLSLRCLEACRASRRASLQTTHTFPYLSLSPSLWSIPFPFSFTDTLCPLLSQSPQCIYFAGRKKPV